MGHMKRATVRELHHHTSALVSAVSQGQVFVIEKRGVPVAELRPVRSAAAGRKLPDWEAWIRRMPRVRTDSGRILEEDRT